MPRRSRASLAVVPVEPAQLPIRPSPPAELPIAAQALWRSLVDSRPATYFAADSLGLLETYCRSIAEYRRLMCAVEAMDPQEQSAEFARLSRVADMHAARASQCATRLRLTKQSQTDSRGAGRDAHKPGRSASADEIRRRYAED